MAYRSQARNKRTGEVIMRQNLAVNPNLGRPQNYEEAYEAAKGLAEKQNRKESKTAGMSTDWVAEAIQWDPADPNHMQNGGRPPFSGAKARATFTWKE